MGLAGRLSAEDTAKSRGSSGDVAAKAAQLVKKLGDDDFQVRERAAAELSKLGEDAVEHLTLGANSPEPEIKLMKPPGSVFLSGESKRNRRTNTSKRGTKFLLKED